MSQTISADDRQLVFQRASGCCEYCRIPEASVLVSHQVDHIVARKHKGSSHIDNLACCCSLCNKCKGSDLASIDPETGQITPLFHPRQDQWVDHFRFDEGHIVPLTAVGRVTVELLQLNRAERIAERKLLIKAGAMNV